MGFILRIQGWYNIKKSVHVIHHIDKMKDKKHKIILTEAGKVFDKTHHPFMIKTLSKVGVEGAFLNIIQAINERDLQPTPYSMDKN